MLNDDLQKLGIDLNPDSQPMGNCRTEDLAPILYAVTELLPETAANKAFIRDMKALRRQYEAGTLHGTDENAWRRDVEGHLKMALGDIRALSTDAQKAFSDSYEARRDAGKQAYSRTAAQKLAGTTAMLGKNMELMVTDALSPDEVTGFNTRADWLKDRIGIRADLRRTSGQSQFFTWLVAERGYTVDEAFDLHKTKTPEEIHQLFVDFNTDFNTRFPSINADSIRTMGERQSKFLDALADAHFPDIDPAKPEEVAAAMEKIAFLNEILVDWGQDTPMLTGISAGSGKDGFDPDKSAAFYMGAGGKDSYETRLQLQHGKLAQMTHLFTTRFPANDPVEMATRMAWFRKAWQDYRGKRLADVDVPGMKTMDYFSKEIAAYAGEREVNPVPVTPEMRAEAEEYLAGTRRTLSWQASAEEQLAKLRDSSRRRENNQISLAAYQLAAVAHDPKQIAEILPSADTSIDKLTDDQRESMLDKVSHGYQSVFTTKLDPRMLEPLYAAGKDSFDAIRIDGKSVREIADQELAGKEWAQPAAPGGPEPKQKIQYMQMMVLKSMTDPAKHVTLTVAQMGERKQLQEMPPFDLSVPMRELKIGPAEESYTGYDLAEVARDLLVEGPVTGLSEEIRALAKGFEQAKDYAIPKSQKDALARLGKDVYDTVFINGRSVNEIYKEMYGDTFKQRPSVEETLKDALIMAHRMQPDCKVEMWRVDEQAKDFKLTEGVAIGVRDDVKGLSRAEKQQISDLNRALTSTMSQDLRKDLAAFPTLSEGVSIEKLRQIDEIWAKMESEKQGLHHDSREYREMKEAVKAVHDAMADFHPSDPSAQAEMRRLLDQVSATATEYTRLKAYDKTKKTGRGVERKNTALALMDLVGAQVDEARVTDRRLTKSEAKRTNKPLSELMREEHEATASAHGAEATRSRKARRHQAAEERKRTDQPAPTAPTGK